MSECVNEHGESNQFINEIFRAPILLPAINQSIGWLIDFTPFSFRAKESIIQTNNLFDWLIFYLGDTRGFYSAGFVHPEIITAEKSNPHRKESNQRDIVRIYEEEEGNEKSYVVDDD